MALSLISLIHHVGVYCLKLLQQANSKHLGKPPEYPIAVSYWAFMNQYFFPMECIHEEVITAKISHYLGNDTLLWSGFHEVS
jgi:hypothetical protein